MTPAFGSIDIDYAYWPAFKAPYHVHCEPIYKRKTIIVIHQHWHSDSGHWWLSFDIMTSVSSVCAIYVFAIRFVNGYVDVKGHRTHQANRAQVKCIWIFTFVVVIQDTTPISNQRAIALVGKLTCSKGCISYLKAKPDTSIWNIRAVHWTLDATYYLLRMVKGRQNSAQVP